jgi:hypothetical protein
MSVLVVRRMKRSVRLFNDRHTQQHLEEKAQKIEHRSSLVRGFRFDMSRSRRVHRSPSRASEARHAVQPNLEAGQYLRNSQSEKYRYNDQFQCRGGSFHNGQSGIQDQLDRRPERSTRRISTYSSGTHRKHLALREPQTRRDWTVSSNCLSSFIKP